MSDPCRRLVQTLSTVISTSPTINVTTRNCLLEHLNTFNREIMEYLFNLSKENIMNKKRIDKLENDIRILHYKKYN
jgi:hypothetical protein